MILHPFSTSQKFSRHLVFQSNKAEFQDNIHAGRFVSYAVSRLLQKLRQLGCMTGDSRKTVAISQGDSYGNDAVNPNHKENLGNDSLTAGNDTKERQTKEGYAEQSVIGSLSPWKMADLSSVPSDDKTKDSPDDYSEIWNEVSVEELKSLVIKNKHGEDILFCDTGTVVLYIFKVL